MIEKKENFVYKIEFYRSNKLLWYCYTTSKQKTLQKIEEYCNLNIDFAYELNQNYNCDKHSYSNTEIVYSIDIKSIEHDIIDGKFNILKIKVF